MLDGIIRHLADGGDASSTVVPVALIGSAGLVLSALVTGFFGTRGERRREPEPDGWEAAHVEDELREVRGLLAARDRWLYRHGFDASRIVTGEESRAHVAFNRP